MSAGKWWPNWYVTRLHVPDSVPDDYTFSADTLCGRTHVAHPDGHMRRSEWQQKRIRAGVPKCKHCLRALDKSA